MKLTGSILQQYLERKYKVTFSRGVQESKDLEGAFYFHARGILTPGWVYVIDGGVLVPDKKEYSENTLLIFTAADSSMIPEKGSVLVLEDEVSAVEVLNEIARAFAFYREWEEKLLEIQYRLGTVDEMLEVSLPVFQNPLIVLNEDLLLVTIAREAEGAGKAGIFMPGRERMDIINAMFQDAEYSKNRKKGGCFWGPEYLLGFRSICWNVVRNDEAQYCLSVIEEERTLTEADMDLLGTLGFHVKFVLYYHEGNRKTDETLSKVLRRILEDRTFDYMEASRMLAESGWLDGHRYLCLLYQLTYLDQKTLPVVNICQFMEEQYDFCCSFSYQDEIVTFFDLSMTSLTEEDIQNQLKPFIRDSYLKAGFSRSVLGHMDLRRQYVQAKLALDVGGRRNPYQWIHYFDRIVQPYIFEQITRRLPGYMLVHKGLLLLQESDRDQGTEYMKTLKVYLDNQQNATQTAKDLFIHRSTFLYRLDRIMEMLDSDLSDPEELLYLSLSFRILNYKK